MSAARKVQTQVDIMEANDNCHIVFHRARYFNDVRSYIAETGSLLKNSETVFISPQELARWGTIAVHSSYMYRRSTRQTTEYKKDFMEWCLAFESLLNGGVAAYLDQILVEYRCNPKGSAYLSTINGREKAYLILIQDVTDYFYKLNEFRADFYAQQVINIIMYTKNIRKIRWDIFRFLLKNIRYFRIFKIIEVARIRKKVGPSKKIR